MARNLGRLHPVDVGLTRGGGGGDRKPPMVVLGMEAESRLIHGQGKASAICSGQQERESKEERAAKASSYSWPYRLVKQA